MLLHRKFFVDVPRWYILLTKCLASWGTWSTTEFSKGFSGQNGRYTWRFFGTPWSFMGTRVEKSDNEYNDADRKSGEDYFIFH